ncbi:MAG: aminoacyl-tRNA deacylase [Gammaproteobacteria bacterium]
MPLQKLQEFLDRHHVKYVTITHSRAYTAQEIAQSAHVSGKELAKTVMVKLDRKLAMAVLPAARQVDFGRLRQGTGIDNAELAVEEEFKDEFAGCDVGAMPPFGNLYGIPVFISRDLTRDESIIFNAGSHTELMRLPYRDYSRLVNPNVIEL